MIEREKSLEDRAFITAVDGRQHRFGFVMEQTLGHVTHYKNLRATIDTEPSIDAVWYPLDFPPQSRVERLPALRSNWSARASWRAWRELSRARAAQTHDALFFHTQVTTLLSVSLLQRVPSVISLDATPINYDTVGAAYGHRQSGSIMERLKRRLNARSLLAASALVTWCDWARESLIADYGVAGERISVIPPGVDLNLWPRPTSRTRNGAVRLLFVGGDFERKGGRVLQEAFAGLEDRCELHVVTKEPIEPAPNLFVYRDVAPNSELLRDLYARADIFVLPTLADCFPLVIQEAMAAGLPIVTTDVGAIGEAVRHGKTGLLVKPGDARALQTALTFLTDDEDTCRIMGRQGREVAEIRFDSAANARKILAIMLNLADSREGISPGRHVGRNRGST